MMRVAYRACWVWMFWVIGLLAGGSPLAAQIDVPGAGEFSSDKVDIEVVSSHDAVPAGTSMQIGFQVSVEQGWMVHSNTPSYSFYTPTRLIIDNMPGISVRSVRYPVGLDRAVAYAENPFNIYEDTFYILVDLDINEQLASRDLHLQMMLNFQACDQEICIGPSGEPFRIPVTILAPDEEPVVVNQQRIERMEESLDATGTSFSWRPWAILAILLLIGWMVAMRIRRSPAGPSE